MGCEQAGSGDITLSITADNLPIATRSTHDNSASGAEVSISHLDVLVFTSEDETNTGEENTLYYYERVSPPADGSGKITLGKKRAEFGTDTYYVYLIANYTGETLDENGAVKINDPDKLFVEGTFTVEDLKALTQYDIDIDLTGSDAQGVSKFFLMDGAAYMEGGTEPAETTSASKLKLYNNDPTNNTRLVVNLRRAAAKIIINIKSSENVRFDNDESVLVDGDQDDEDSMSAGAVAYYFQHITTQTHVIPPVKIYTENDTKEVSTDGMMRESGWGFAANDEYLVLVSKDDPNAPEKDGEANKYVESIMVQGYAYAHNWNNKDMGHDTRLVVNIPLWHKTTIKTETTDAEGNTVITNTDSWDFFGNNFYQVPVSKTKKLERNTLYIVNVTVDTKGSMSYNSAVQLTDVTFDTRDWKDVEVNVGSSQGNKPVFLSVNEENVSMYNTDINSTLKFSSSSDVSVRVVNYYFVDASGKEVYHDTGVGKDGKSVTGEPERFQHRVDEDGKLIRYRYEYVDRGYNWVMQESDEWKNGTVVDSEVTVSWDSSLNGGIKVNSTPPQNCAVRYIILEVKNADGIERQVTLEQYPLEYVTHKTGWYSYREDFGGTTWQTLANNEDLTFDANATTNSFSRTNINISNNSWICGCSIYTANNGNEYWTYNSSGGFFQSKVALSSGAIQYARWSRSGYGSYTYTRNSSNSASKDNPRMYHLHLMISSDTYTTGVPRQENGYTAQDADNQLVLSPSLMIASQLAVVSDCPSLELSADHCKQYVETYKEGNEVIHLDDWRLPTEAELEFIMKYQYLPNGVLDEVLAGRYYIAASGKYVTNPVRKDKDNYVLRCVRDAFITPNARNMPVVGSSEYER